MGSSIIFKLFLCSSLLTVFIIAKETSNKQNLSSKLVGFSLPSISSPSARIVTGPIIGKVTETTARILFEFDIQVPIEVILTDSNGSQVIAIKMTKSFVPIPFAFEGLHPNTRYTVSLNDSRILMTESYFTTLSGESGKLNFAFVSCNSRIVQVLKTPEDDLWVDLLKRIKSNEIQYLFHLGDQIYADLPIWGVNPPSSYVNCINLLTSTPREQWANLKLAVLEIIRNEYRQTWNLPTVKETLAKIPSLAIFDDHEVVNDWGFDPVTNNPETAYYFYATHARQVYYEYERQLREDINFDDLSSITEDYYYEILNDIGFFFIEYRGIRSWNRGYSQMGDSQLGATQTALLKQVFDPNQGEFAHLNNAFIMSPLTIIEPGQEGKPGKVVTNKESWGYAYLNEQAEFLDLLRIWKFAKEGRELTLLGGDTHIGGYSDIMYNGEYVFFQFTSSSIASFPPSDAEFLSFDITGEIEPLVAPWTFQHYDWTNKHNYGVVWASNQDGTAIVDTYLVEALTDTHPPPPVSTPAPHVVLASESNNPASESNNQSHNIQNMTFLVILITVIYGI